MDNAVEELMNQFPFESLPAPKPEKPEKPKTVDPKMKSRLEETVGTALTQKEAERYAAELGWTEPKLKPVTKSVPPATGSGMRLSKAFLLAGHAIFTVGNPGGERYTFRVIKKDPDPDRRPAPNPLFFVAYLAGPENTSDYRYMGVLNPDATDRKTVIRLTKASKVTEGAKVLDIARWVALLILRDEAAPAGYYLKHAGRCGRCGRLLTVPESIDLGIGPECAGRMGL